ncbi:hypothetical protein AB0P17_29115 [Streptomyces sp. NPDC088124]|uniref:hypothetical protein n=1 Tax=Streptomyces sp. NPDC088124 TaxID=3154654 RepID=UPI0034437F85
MRVKTLIKNVNPVPRPGSEGLSARATGELAALIGSVDGAADGAAGTVATGARRAPRRSFLMAAVACGAAAVIGGVSLFLLQSDPAGPGGGTGGGTLADEPYFETTAQLEGVANVIVRAKLGAGREENADDISTTVATAEVVATAKGTTPGGSIEVAYTTPGSGPETAGLTAGKEYVLLLEESDGGRYILVNTTQGWYGVGGDGRRAVAGSDNDVSLSPGVLKALRLTE